MVNRKEKEFYIAQELAEKLRNTIKLSFKKIRKIIKTW